MAEKIIIAIPIGKNHQIDIRAAGFCAAMNRYHSVKWMWSVSHYPEMGRNAIIEKQLSDPELTHIFFLDTDTVPPIDAIPKMLKVDKPFVSAVTPMICGNEHVWNVKTIDDPDKWWPRAIELPNKPFITKHAGGSCLLIRREVFEAVKWPWFKTIFQEMDKDDVAKKEGEDTYFCNRARECGFDVWVQPDVKCSHYNYINLLTYNFL